MGQLFLEIMGDLSDSEQKREMNNKDQYVGDYMYVVYTIIVWQI